jgi:hypothetical protein
MFPFTYEMFDAFSKCSSISIDNIQRHIEYLKFEHEIAIGQLNDESTDGDYKEINYIKGSLDDYVRSRKLVSQYQKCMHC